jgi:hypothetical protein
MKGVTPGRAILVAFLVVLAGAAYENKLVSSGNYNWPPPPIDSSWVRQFMGNVSTAIGIGFKENTSLDLLARERFYTAVLKPNITHFGADSELPPGTGEVIYYPSGYSPLGYVQGIEFHAPIHWKLMSSLGFSQYGYYLGEGPVARVSEACTAPELPGPNINVTSFYAKYDCPVIWVNSTWLVIDMSK